MTEIHCRHDFRHMADFAAWPVIGKGMERICYLNPSDRTRLFKISPKSRAKQTLREIKYFRFLIEHGIPFDHLPKFYGEIRGNDFIGFEQEFIPSAENNALPETLASYLARLSSPEQIQLVRHALEKLKSYLLRYNILALDIHPDNIVVQNTETGIRMVLIDGIYNTEWIPVSTYSRFFGKRKILRKWEKFSKNLSARYPLLHI